MKHIKSYEKWILFEDTIDNINKKEAYKKMLNVFIDVMFGLGGVMFNCAFQAKEDKNNAKYYKQIFNFLENDIKPSFEKKIIYDFIWYYKNCNELTNVVYQTLKYVKKSIICIDFKYNNIKTHLIKRIDVLEKDYITFIDLYKINI